MPWNGARRPLGGRATIKIALGTRDLQLARKRWLDVHPQIEDHVESARLRTMTAQPCSTVRAVQGLSASEIEHIATRYDQQVISADDDEVLHRERSGDLTELVLAERDGNPTETARFV